jgi:hypothetical protein
MNLNQKINLAHGLGFFVGRHKRGVAVAALALTLSLGIAGWNWQHSRHVKAGTVTPQEAAQMLAEADGPGGIEYGPIESPAESRVSQFCELFVGGKQITATNALLDSYTDDYDPALMSAVEAYQAASDAEYSDTYEEEVDEAGATVEEYCANR